MHEVLLTDIYKTMFPLLMFFLYIYIHIIGTFIYLFEYGWFWMCDKIKHMFWRALYTLNTLKTNRKYIYLTFGYFSQEYSAEEALHSSLFKDVSLPFIAKILVHLNIYNFSYWCMSFLFYNSIKQHFSNSDVLCSCMQIKFDFINPI